MLLIVNTLCFELDFSSARSRVICPRETCTESAFSASPVFIQHYQINVFVYRIDRKIFKLKLALCHMYVIPVLGLLDLEFYQ